ncbi:MAG: hypothetical protein QXE94_06040 [Candidatus Bathyarchaeia archaeon]
MKRILVHFDVIRIYTTRNLTKRIETIVAVVILVALPIRISQRELKRYATADVKWKGC